MTAAGELAVSVEGLRKTYPRPRSLGALLRHPFRFERTTALEALSLSLRHGEVLGLIGPNGAGKTTLIKVLAGVVLADEGTARIDGLPAGESAARERVGLVTADERSFYWRISSRENLRFFGALHGFDRARTDGRIAMLVDRLQLGEVIDRPFRELSSGNRGRLALARGLLHEPRVLLLDEVGRALDPGAARRLRTLLRELVAETGVGALYATHDLAEVRRLCARVVLLDGGRAVAEGSFEEVSPVAREVFDLEAEDLQ